ncbi:hypothetical protein COCOBI_05-5890 [Coccomyxa sp. Obi]|nr:hypothetical protein COCOBI_05-5890 [Coccomyxa sp. Obi]
MASAQHLEDPGTKESDGIVAAPELQKKDMGHHLHDHDFVMVNEDANSSQGQSACATPAETPLRGGSPVKTLQLIVPSPDSFPSPRLHFASINAKSAAALEAVFGQDFDVNDHLGVQLMKHEVSRSRSRAVSDGAESLVGQPQSPSLALSIPAKQLLSPETQGVGDKEAPEMSTNAGPKAAPTVKERLAEALREIERLQAALEDANQQQEWVLGNVVKIREAEKEELTRALQDMTASRDALELELKHNEKEFASLVTEELEQRFARFEDVTLAAVSKMGPSAATSSSAPASAPYRTPTGPARIAPPAVSEGRVLGAPTQPAVRSNILVAHLGTVGPNMTLLEALQSRQATDALRAMERARDSPRPPLDICLQGSLRAIQVTPSALKASVAAAGNAVQQGAAVAGSRTRSGALGIASVAAGGASWIQHNLVDSAKSAIVQVPALACKPFQLFGHASKQFSSFLHRKDVLEVLEMYWGITAASLLALSTLLMGALVLDGVRDTLCRPTRWGPNQATLSTMQQLADQVHTVEQKASTLESETRKYDAAMAAAMEETLRASKESLSTVLEAKRAMHDRIAAAERRAIRAEHAAKKAAAAVAAEAPTAAAGEQALEQPDQVVDEVEVWRMEPEELFSWSGFPDIDLRSVVDKIRSSSCSAFRRPRD